MTAKKIENLADSEEIQKLIVKKASTGQSAGAIADDINAEFQTDLQGLHVSRYMQRARKKIFEHKFQKEGDKFPAKLSQEYFDTIRQMKELSQELWGFFSELKDNRDTTKSYKCWKCKAKNEVKTKEYTVLLKTAMAILDNIRHQNRVLGMTHKAPLKFETTYNFTDMSQKLTKIMPEMVHALAKQGDIKILKKRKYKLV